jgi:hypothetical protein
LAERVVIEAADHMSCFSACEKKSKYVRAPPGCFRVDAGQRHGSGEFVTTAHLLRE